MHLSGDAVQALKKEREESARRKAFAARQISTVAAKDQVVNSTSRGEAIQQDQLHPVQHRACDKHGVLTRLMATHRCARCA